jgi:hypothetical protein
MARCAEKPLRVGTAMAHRPRWSGNTAGAAFNGVGGVRDARSFPRVAVPPTLPRILAHWPFARPVVLYDEVFQPHGAVRAENALRVQGACPIAYLRLVVHKTTALRHDCEEQLSALGFKVKFAINPGINIQQPHAWGELLGAFPNPIHVNGPSMLDCFDDLSREDILGTLEALSW